jgi:hypothetical protein
MQQGCTRTASVTDKVGWHLCDEHQARYEKQDARLHGVGERHEPQDWEREFDTEFAEWTVYTAGSPAGLKVKAFIRSLRDQWKAELLEKLPELEKVNCCGGGDNFGHSDTCEMDNYQKRVNYTWGFNACLESVRRIIQES